MHPQTFNISPSITVIVGAGLLVRSVVLIGVPVDIVTIGEHASGDNPVTCSVPLGWVPFPTSCIPTRLATSSVPKTSPFQLPGWYPVIFTFTFTFRAFSRHFKPKRLTVSTFVRRKRIKLCISVGRVKMFIETSTKQLQLLGKPLPVKKKVE